MTCHPPPKMLLKTCTVLDKSYFSSFKRNSVTKYLSLLRNFDQLLCAKVYCFLIRTFNCLFDASGPDTKERTK